MDIIYRTDDMSKWGFGLGSDLDAVQIDLNFWNLNIRIATMEAAGFGKQIDYMAESNGAIFVHYTDHTIDGPFPIPLATFLWRAQWQPNTAYHLYDIVYNAGSIYLAVMDFTSGTTFAPNDGLGHTWLQLMLTIPSIPSVNISTATFTPDLPNANTYIRCTHPTGCIFTMPNDSAVNWGALGNPEIHVRDETESGGAVHFVEGSGVLLKPPEGRLLQTSTPGAVIGMKWVAANTWDMWGMFAFA